MPVHRARSSSPSAFLSFNAPVSEAIAQTDSGNPKHVNQKQSLSRQTQSLSVSYPQDRKQSVLGFDTLPESFVMHINLDFMPPLQDSVTNVAESLTF